jgi:hypothetical protein
MHSSEYMGEYCAVKRIRKKMWKKELAMTSGKYKKVTGYQMQTKHRIREFRSRQTEIMDDYQRNTEMQT